MEAIAAARIRVLQDTLAREESTLQKHQGVVGGYLRALQDEALSDEARTILTTLLTEARRLLEASEGRIASLEAEIEALGG